MVVNRILVAMMALGLVIAVAFFISRKGLEPEQGPVVETDVSRHEEPAPSKPSPIVKVPSPQPDEYIVLRGRAIFASSRQPAGGAIIMLKALPFEEPVAEITADAGGQFEFTLENGGYFGLSGSTGGWMTTAPTNLLIDNKKREYGPVELQLEKGQRATIKVVGGPKERPVRDAVVRISGVKNTLVTDRRGEADVFVTRGRLSLQVSAEGFMSVSREIAAEPRANRLILIKLEPGASCAGRIVDPEDQPIEHAQVTIFDTINTKRHETYTNAEGLFLIEDLPRNVRFQVGVWKMGYLHASLKDLQSSDVEPHVEVKLVLYPNPESVAAPRGRVKNSLGEPVAGATLELIPILGETSAHTLTDHNGYFDFEFVPFPFRFATLVVTAKGYARWSERARAPEEWDITLVDGSWLSGKAVNVAGDPLPGAAVFIGDFFKELPKKNIALTDPDGNFYLPDLTAGHPLLFFLPGYAPRVVYPEELNHNNELVVLEEEGILVGKVLDRASGKPIPQYKIQVLEERGWVQNIQRKQVLGLSDHLEVYNKEGRFRIAGLIPDELLKLRISGPNHPAKNFSFMIPKRSESKDREFVLDAGDRQLIIGVVNSEGQVLEGIQGHLLILTDQLDKSRWILEMSKSPYTQMAESDSSGIMTFQDLPDNTPFGLVLEGPGVSTLLTEAPPVSELGEEKVHWLTLLREARLYGGINRDVYPRAYQMIVNSRVDGFNTKTIALEPDQDEYEINGLPQGEVNISLLGNGESGAEILENETVPLVEGQSHQLDFGDQELFRVEGYAFYGGDAMVGGVLFLLQGNSWQKTTTSSNGYFLFEEVENGDYQLVASWVPNPEELGQATLLSSFPNRHGIQVVDQNINDHFVFQSMGTLYGHVPPQGSWHVLLEGVMDEGGQHFRSQPPDEKGFFSFPNLPAGIYRIGRYPNGHPADYEVLASQIVMPRDGSDLDLGLLTPNGRGRVLVLVDTHGDAYDWHFKIRANPLFQASPDGLSQRASVEKSFYQAPGEMMLENLGSGPYEISVEASNNQVFWVDPPLARADPDPRNPPKVRFTIHAGTWLDIVARDPQIAIASARMVRDGETVVLDAWYGGDFPNPAFDEEVALFYGNVGMVRNLPQGSWTLEVIDKLDRTYHQKVKLEVGREKTVTVEFR